MQDINVNVQLFYSFGLLRPNEYDDKYYRKLLRFVGQKN